MEKVINEIINIQLKLMGEIARQTEGGATNYNTCAAIAETMSVKLNTPTSGGWVYRFVRDKPKDLLNTSFARIRALNEILEENMMIWGTN
jgi:hypothetical protein